MVTEPTRMVVECGFNGDVLDKFDHDLPSRRQWNDGLDWELSILKYQYFRLSDLF
jgi:hypothetical protein